MIYVFLAEGFEEMEALSPVDILRRAGIECKTVGVTGKTVAGSHGIPVTADILPEEIDYSLLSGVILPGGMPGAENLEKSQSVIRAVKFADENDKLIAAICAAPYILGKLGILNGRKATCFDGFEKYFDGGEYTENPVETDGNVITAFGAGAALLFALEIVKKIKGHTAAQKLYDGMKCIF
ncbi:MAG: DJ-1/PfpI family protein [Clostridiales bacterium]|nr:DJ-1/PfpI family protein [Candidatus Equinaster intestinalis]